MSKKLSLNVRRTKTLNDAWVAIHRNARNSKSETTKNEIEEFSGNLQNNLKRIQLELRKKTFKFPPAKGIKIPKDKRNKNSFRPLVVAKVESRIVQRAIHDVLVTVPEIQKYIYTPYRFGGVKKREDDNFASVPAAIKAVLDAIGSGGSYIIRSDISSFFTRIPKSCVTKIVSDAVSDLEFLDLFSSAIAVELENMAQLKSHASAFPISDIGVAQGNSLSPLLGNILLYDFDNELNKHSDVKCLRYIDDFIIIAPKQQVAENAFSKAVHLLGKLGMGISTGKTQKANVENGFEFLGIDLSNGFIRPSRKSQQRLIYSINSTIKLCEKAFIDHRSSNELDRALSLIETLRKVSGIMQGWGKHYRFCNDTKCFERLDIEVGNLIKDMLCIYRAEHARTDDAGRWRLLGIEAISQIEKSPFIWPKKSLPAPVD
ncbi:reverse transcriptase domain-containing protein [Methylosinus sp. R-45379]|uniref:reverse transcriptase domain-containing protein n=1 Tax=Methylosinus sp. R-45379 TaxID=980563 RepID=UPI0009FD9389|nr:reverse transcriptase domain-containing protein [Methylosinus sp. R-45379]